MFRWIRSRVGIKLLLAFSIVLILSMLSLNFLATRSITSFGEYSADTTEINIRKNIDAFLSRITIERSRRYEAIFQRIADSSAMLAKWAGFLVDNTSLFEKATPDENNELVLYPPNGIFSNRPSQKTMVLYWGASTLTSEITAQIKASSFIDPFLIESWNANPECMASFIVSRTGICRYYPNVHSVLKLAPPSEYDMREAVFYTIAGPEKNPAKKTVWTNAYKDPSGQELITTATTPIYSQTGEFFGVTGINISLETIMNEILGDQGRSQDNTLQESFSFLVDHKGTIIAMPPEYMQLFGIRINPGKLLESGTILETSLMRSNNQEVRKLCREIISKNYHYERIVLNGSAYIITSQYMSQTAWRFGFVMPESVALASVQETRAGVNFTVEKMNTLFVVVTIAFLLCSIFIIAIYLFNNVIKPIGRLSKAAEQVKDGNLIHADLDIHQSDEIGTLATSFSNMVESLRKGKEIEQEYAQTLEKKVAERTDEIEQKAQELQKTLSYLKQEMSEKEIAETALRESEAKFKSLGENAPDIIYTLSADGIYTYVNSVWEEILGHARNEVIGRHFVDFLKPDEAGKHDDYFQNITTKKETIRDRMVTMIHQNGSPRLFSMSGAPNFDAKGIVIGVVGLFKDITEQRKMEAHLQHSQKMESIGTLTTGVAHNFRNIMASVLANNQLLQMKYKNDPQVLRYTESIAGAVNKGAQLVDGLMHFSRKEESRQAAHLNLTEVVLETYQVIARSFDKSVTINIDIPQPLHIQGVHSALSQVFMNLSTNARDAMPEGGELYIGAKEDRGKALVLFSDTGHGMDKEVVAQCFDPFFTTKEVGRGTGLGLSTAYGIVKDHGGDIHVYSEPGKGTVFKLYFPLVLFEKTAVPEPELEIINGHGEKILIVDDEVDILEPIHVLLEEMNYRVVSVSRGDEAIEKYKTWQPDVVLLDRNMPGMDGITCAKRIRAYDPKAKIVLISGYVDMGPNGIDDEIKSFLEGYLTKPFQITDLGAIFTRLFHEKNSLH